MKKIFFIAAVLLAVPQSFAEVSRVEKEKEAIRRMAGCYLVDYSYVETEGLAPGYQRDNRVYEVNKTRSIKEWIYSEDISPTRIRIQHILFATDLKGNLIPGSELKHTGEDWELNALFLYDFTQPLEWQVKPLSNLNAWTRKITNLDDGLRHQCSAEWNVDDQNAKWSCESEAPIPGRETRDMGRKDYNTLKRNSEVIIYGNSWLERQDNIKINHVNGVKTKLAKEIGKNWYVRIDDQECQSARDFVKPRKSFWAILRSTWDEVLIGDRPFIETTGMLPSRYQNISLAEEGYLTQDLGNPKIRQSAHDEILQIIKDFRAN